MEGFKLALVNQIVVGEPISLLFTKKLKCSPGIYGFLALFWAIITHLIVGNIIGVTLYPINYEYYGFLPAWHEAFQEFLFIPIIWWCYGWMPHGISNLFFGLWKNKVISSKHILEDYQKTILQYYRLSRFVPIVAIIILIPVFLIEVNYWLTWKIAYFPLSNVYFIFEGVYMGISWYFIIIMACRELITIIATINQLQNKELSFNIWQSDNKTGLSPLIDYRLRISFILAILALIIVIIGFPGPYKSPAPSQGFSMWIAAYLIISPLIFFLPIYSAHVGLKNAKKNYLDQLSSIIYSTNTKIIVELPMSNKTKFDLLINKFNHLVSARLAVIQQSDWPIDLISLLKYLLITFFPTVINLLSFFF